MVACTCSLKPPCLAALLGVGSCPCCAGPHHRHGGIPVRMQYRSTKTPFKTHTSRVRRKRQRLPSNASIRTDAAIRFPPVLSGLLRRVTSDRMLEFHSRYRKLRNFRVGDQLDRTTINNEGPTFSAPRASSTLG